VSPDHAAEVAIIEASRAQREAYYPQEVELTDWRIVMILLALMAWWLLGQDRERSLMECKQVQSEQVCERTLR
jgi:hypothetical protein